jgi:hypothetical protein
MHCWKKGQGAGSDTDNMAACACAFKGKRMRLKCNLKSNCGPIGLHCLKKKLFPLLVSSAQWLIKMELNLLIEVLV